MIIQDSKRKKICWSIYRIMCLYFQLENHKTLVEQCIRGTGVVQVNIQIRAFQKKINIMDVLKPDEELLQLPQEEECKLLFY